MRPLNRKIVFTFLFLLLAVPGIARAEDDAPAETITQERRPLTYFQLRGELMNFADRYMQMIGQASDTLQRKTKDPDARTGIHSLKLFPCSAAFTIAADMNPQMSLLDMTVLVHLQGTVWRETAPKRFGADAPILLNVQKTLEEDIDGIAVKVLSPEKFAQLLKLVEDWHRAHPDQRYVSYIRFSDFVEMRRGDGRPGKGGPNILSIAGLLSTFQLVNIDEASRSMDQARMVAERALYLSERMPTLLRWQGEMFVYQMASTLEVKNLMETSRSLRTFPERLTIGGLILAVAIFLLALLYRFLALKIK